MKLSGELRQRLNELNERRDHYVYQGESLKDKTLTRLIAPSAVGKSTIINRILKLAEEQGMNAAEVGTVTTRPRRPGDPANYITADEGVTHESMIERIEKGELVSWSLFDTGHLYATAIESYPAEYNFLPCLPDSLPMQDRAGFGALRTFYIVTSSEAWYRQLEERRGPGFDGRLEEAMSSIEFAQTTYDMHKFVCLPGDEELTTAANRIINFTKRENMQTFGPHTSLNPVKDAGFDMHCRDMYRLALQLRREVEDVA